MSEFIGYVSSTFSRLRLIIGSSRISLISKSDIRYVGRLHEINSENSTVALEHVTSFGTEGRKGNPSQEVPASEQLFEYIVFRGSDVKDLQILEAAKENNAPAVPNDPAILGSARPPNQQQAQPPPQNQFQSPPPQQAPPSYHQFDPRGGPPPFQARFQGPGGPHGFPGQPGAVPGFHPGFGAPPPNFYGPPPGAGFIQHQPPQGPFPQQTPIGPPEESRPSPNAKPEAIQASRLAAAQKPAEMSGTPVPTANTGPPPPLESKPAAKAAAAQATNTAEKQPAAKKTNNRVAVPLAAPKVPPKPAAKPAAQPSSYADATQAATAAVAAAMAQLAPTQQAQPDDNLAQKVGQMRLTHDANTRGRGRGRGGAPRGGRAKPVDVPKEDFDFESSNAKFNKQDLVKEAATSPAPTNGADENGHDDDVVIPPKSTAEKGYDKKTSFFDNISSDLKDRADPQTIDGRAMRNQERNRNMETFGQGSVDGGHRGGYRGRGRGRGFGRGRGGPRGGFDGSRGARGRGRNAEGEIPA